MTEWAPSRTSFRLIVPAVDVGSAEVAAVERAGGQYSLVDFEALVNDGDAARAVRRVPGMRMALVTRTLRSGCMAARQSRTARIRQRDLTHS